MGARELGPLLEIEEIQTRTEDDASRQLSWFVDFLAAISQDIHSHLYTAGAICNENPNANAKSTRVATRQSVLI
ncbi:hypothetical protein ACLKA7_012731 [Drosophila subpalustris]